MLVAKDLAVFDDDTQRFYSFQFCILLFLIVPSILASLFALYSLILDQNFRREFRSYTLILLLLINLFYNSIHISYFIYYFHAFRTFLIAPMSRLVWGYFDWQIYVLQILLYAWFTTERHILIFHDRLLTTRRRRLVIHYLPPYFVIVYCFVYYTFVFFVSSCINNFSRLIRPGFFPCAFRNATLFLYDLIAHGVMPTFTIILSSIALFIRVLYQKHRVQQPVQWRRYRKLTVQILVISFLFLVLLFPPMLIQFLHICGMSTSVGSEFSLRMIFVSYYTFLLFLIFTISSLPELRAKLNKILLCLQCTVQPISNTHIVYMSINRVRIVRER
ncbi:unnamed protein product [Adineta ricciae]|uniref:G-protein coupled receptors family 1 profile domain-containing protein n=1 Tax=Adineta ricciae TaxID=249248 RepID=A0A814WCU0_ADIRI|nr:unnamed protein product [Adineta ricciae]CAF1562322.1 unnamed protein product [Adineta ricciae]